MSWPVEVSLEYQQAEKHHANLVWGRRKLTSVVTDSFLDRGI